jgi:diaminopimelate decarboxylase
MWIKEQLKKLLMHRAKVRDAKRRLRLGMSGHDLLPHHWDAGVNERGHLVLGGCDAVDLAYRFGTPLHVVDLARLQNNFIKFRNAFQCQYPRVEIGYSYKTNPLPGAILHLHQWGAFAEVISGFELWLALELGVPAERIIVNGPGKDHDMLELAVAKRVRIINIDNLDEPETIQRHCVKNHVEQEVGVRVVTTVGWSSQFGLSIRTGAAKRAFELLMRQDRLRPSGIHLHLGTGISNDEIYVTAIREVLDFAKTIERDLGIQIKFLDFGGGFGVPTVRSFSQMDRWLIANEDPPMVVEVGAQPKLDRYGERIGTLLREYYPDESTAPTLFFEPGRAITSSAQTLLLRVLAIKEANGKTQSVILNGGVNLAMPVMWEYHEILAAGKLNRECEALYRLCGPLCHPGDVLAAAKRLPRLETGDILAIMDAGAYFIPNQTNFSNPRAAAVIAQDGSAELVREREPFAHIVSLDRLSLSRHAV